MKRILTHLLATTLCINPFFGAVASSELPDFGETAGAALSKQQEIELGQEILKNIRRTTPIVYDELSNYYIRNLGHKIANHYEDDTVPFYFFLVKSPAINAFALPGGNIGINTGLILAADTESELAGVLAHEISHVTQRHIAQMFEKMKQMRIPTIAAMLASIALATQNAQAGSSAIAATLAGTQQYAISFTRENEEEADRVGIDLLAKSGFNPQGMPKFFRKLQEKSRYYESTAFEFLRTHPMTTARIADTENRAKALTHHTKTKESKEFALIKARLNVLLTQNSQEAKLNYEKAIQSASLTKEPAVYYGYALSLLKSGNTNKATQIARKLIRSNPKQWIYQHLLAETYLQSNKPENAIAVIDKLKRAYPKNHVILMQAAKAYLKTNQAEKARNLLSRHSFYVKDDPLTFELLYEAAAKAGNLTQAHIAKAEFLTLFGDLNGAISQINIALKKDNLSDYDKARLDAKLKVYKEAYEEKEA